MGERSKVCILAPVHPPFDIRVFTKEAVSLAEAGHEVVLYTRADGTHPGDEMYSGVRLKTLAYKTRLARFLLLPSLLLRARRERADVYHLHNPDTAILGLCLKLTGATVVYDTHEDFVARIPTKQWIPVPLKRITAYAVDILERLTARLVDAVIVTQENQVKKFGAVLIENFPRTDPGRLDAVRRLASGVSRGGELRLIYVGEFNAIRGMFFLLDIVAELNKSRPTRLWVTGTDHGEGWVARAGEHPAWRHVDHLGYLKIEEVFAHIMRADFGAALYEDAGDLARISSNKIYEYQTYGTPFVATALPERRSALGEKGGGLFVAPGDPVAAAREILRVFNDRAAYDELVEKGRKLVFEECNWRSEEAKLLALYRKLAGDAR